MSSFEVVLFDCGDTLFHLDGPTAIVSEAARSLGHDLSDETIDDLWERAHSRDLPAELRRQRDRSPEGHRRYWITAFRDFEAIEPGLSELIYDAVNDPRAWLLYADTESTLRALAARGG